MESRRWQKIEELFHAALDLPDTGRAAYLDRVCAGDPALRAEVDSLLDAHANNDAASLIRGVVSNAAHDASDDALSWPGRRIGPYEVHRVLGRGGMGLVLLATRADRDFEQNVAIKLMHGLTSGELRTRFRSERQILARLQHPHIARLIDGGETSDGLLYLVMEYVEGIPIDRYCDEHRLSTRERLDLFRLVCDAVQAAHRHLVVHRDIKPGNILVTADGTPRLLDFGIAKLTEEVPGVDTAPTLTGMRALTPAYASPEQVRGEPVTTASDVYSLGVLLYELLTGRRPYRIDTQAPADVQRVVCDTNPERPSSVVTRVDERAERTPREIGEARSTRPDRLQRELSGDLDNIVLMAMRKEPERRYPSVEQFAEDVRNHLRGRPVAARSDSASYRVAKFVRRNRVLVGSLTAVFAALVTGLVISTSQHHHAVRERKIAEEKTHEAERAAYASSLAAGEASIRMNQIGEARSQLESAPESLRGWEWRHLWSRLDRSRYVIKGHHWGITRIAFSPDGNRFVSGGQDSSVALWQTDTGELIRRWDNLTSGVESVAFHPGGQLVAAGLADGAVEIWNADTGEPHAHLDAPVPWAMVAYSPDGSRLLTGYQRGPVIERRSDTLQETGTFDSPGGFVCVAYSPDGRTIITGTGDGHVHLFDARTRKAVADVQAHHRRVMNVAVARNGSVFATTSMDRTARVWTLRGCSPQATFRGHTATVAGVAFDGGCDHVITTGADRQILEWNTTDGAPVTELRGGGEDAYCVAVSPDGNWFVTGSWAGRIRLWSKYTTDVRVLRPPAPDYMHTAVSHAAISADGRMIASVSEQPIVHLWNADTGELVAVLRTERAGVATRVLFGPGDILYAGTRDGSIVAFDHKTGRRITDTVAHALPVTGLALSPDGTTLVSASADSTLALWSTETLAPRGRLEGHAGAVAAVDYCPDGRIASGSADGSVRFWSTEDLDTVRVIHDVGSEVVDIAVSPDGTRLVTAGRDERVLLWRTEDGMALGPVGSGRGRVNAVCFTPDGTRIVVGGSDQIVRIVETGSGNEVARFHGHVGRILSLECSPVHDRVVSSSFDGTIRLWDAD